MGAKKKNPVVLDMTVKKSRIAIIVGHCEKEPGAFNETVGSEWQYNSKVAALLTDVADIFFYDNFNKGYTQTVIQDMCPKTKNYDLVIELHFNSFNKEANGCEGLYYYKNELGRELCLVFNNLMKERFNSITRGAKALRGVGDRGFACVYYQRPTTIMLEPFFCNGKEAVKFDEPHEIAEYAKVIRDLISYFQLKKSHEQSK